LRWVSGGVRDTVAPDIHRIASGVLVILRSVGLSRCPLRIPEQGDYNAKNTALSHDHERGQLSGIIVSHSNDGRTRAIDATRSGEKRIVRSGKRPSSLTILLALVFLSTVGASAFVNKLPLVVPTAYLMLSAITYLAYAWDKATAKAGRLANQ